MYDVVHKILIVLLHLSGFPAKNCGWTKGAWCRVLINPDSIYLFPNGLPPADSEWGALIFFKHLLNTHMQEQDLFCWSTCTFLLFLTENPG